MPKPTTSIIRRRLVDQFLGSRIMDNALRGYWCEAMVAEALGSGCTIVSAGWHAWDIEIGPSNEVFPKRIRVQVKNSARLQTWNLINGKVSDPVFHLTYRPRPSYFVRDSVDIPCEDAGFLCDVYILCYHPSDDVAFADHRDPEQWEFYLVPVVGSKSAVTESEVDWAKRKVTLTGRPCAMHRRPATLRLGIRGRRAVEPIGIDELTIETLFSALL